jgi:chromosome segregation ATPase
MQILKMVIIGLLGTVFFTGCISSMIDEPIEITLPTFTKPAIQNPQNKSIEQRFLDPQEKVPGAVESALMWSRKYDELSNKTESLMDKNNSITKENSELKHQLSQLQLEMEQTKKELNSANAFLQEMQQELNHWKNDVLGFRDEMRRAESTQLEALSRILKLLGAEMTEPEQ